MNVVITAANALTPVGFTATSTASAVRAGISRLQQYPEFLDVESNPVIAAMVPDWEDWEESSDRMADMAEICLQDLIASASIPDASRRSCHLWLAGAPEERHGALFSTIEDELPARLIEIARTAFSRVDAHVHRGGNAATFFSLEEAILVLERDRDAVCVLGAVDSLLDEQNLDELDDQQRLKSHTSGRAHGLSPAEATGFLVVEAPHRARRRGLAEVLSVATTMESAPLSSDAPSTGQGLTEVVRAALAAAGGASAIDAVVCDLNGEFFRAKEWAYADLRLFKTGKPKRRLVHPADCFGTIGAAFPAVLIGMVATSRGWLDGSILIFASDDSGPRGAAVVRRRWQPTSVP